MDWLNALSDDQVALIGCVIALATAFGVMSLTWTVRQKLEPRDAASEALLPSTAAQSPGAQQPERRAA